MTLPAALGIAGTAAGIGQSLFRLGTGVAQLASARKYRMERPTYEIPEEISNQLGLRQQLLNARMPGAQDLERNIMQSQAQSMYNAQQAGGDSASLLAAGAATQGGTNRAMRDLQIREAQDYENRVRGLESAQNTMAGFRDKEFQMNEMQPYMEASATRSGLIEGGIQNISSALGDTSARLGKMYEAEQMYGLYSKLFGMKAGQVAQGSVANLNAGLMGAYNRAKGLAVNPNTAPSFQNKVSAFGMPMYLPFGNNTFGTFN